MKISIFCDVIDNYGDIGVVYRFCNALYQKNPDWMLEIFCNNLESFYILDNTINPKLDIQKIKFGYCYNWKNLNSFINTIEPGDVIIEAFACEIPSDYLDLVDLHKEKQYIWINLEYLTAEKWSTEYHLLPSVSPKSNVKKYFYMPGFYENNGGIIIDDNFTSLCNDYQNLENEKAKIISIYQTNNKPIDKIINIFSYQYNCGNLFTALLKSKINILIFGYDRMTHASFDVWAQSNKLEFENNILVYKNFILIKEKFISQQDFDMRIAIGDMNFVRGEESFVRALLAGKPFIWQAYLQKDGYQIKKVEAFMEFYKSFLDSSTSIEIKDILFSINNTTEYVNNSVSSEDYTFFIQNLDKISLFNKNLSKFLINNCNMVAKFTSFVKEWFPKTN